MVLFSLSKREYEEKYHVTLRNPFVIKRHIVYLKEWISKQPHLPQDHDDQWLESFLAGCKYNIQTCKKKLDTYFTVRVSMPHWFSMKDPASQDIRTCVSEVALFLLPTPNSNGSFIVFGKLLGSNNETIDIRSNIQRLSIYCDCFLRHTYNHELTFVIDCEDGTMQHVLQAIQEQITDAIYYFMNAYPFEVKEFHTINMPAFADFVKSIVLPTLPEEARERVHFHSEKLDSLYEFVPQELLPYELGGKAGTIKELNDSFYKKIESCRAWLMDHGKIVVDESKRPDTMSQEQNLFRPERSFRSLQID